MACKESESTLNANLLKLLECPVCLQAMYAPIVMCKNGHNVCSPCRQMVQWCPTCKGEFTDARNRFAEEIADKILFACPNCDFGCPVKMLEMDISDHVMQCQYVPYKCLPGSKVGCSWIGRKEDIVKHVKQYHPERAKMKDENNVYIKHFNFEDDLRGAQLIVAHGQIFWYRVARDALKKRFYIAVQYIGQENEVGNYKYKIELSSEDDVTSVMFSNFVHPDKQSMEEICESCKCFCLDYGLLECFLTAEKMLQYKLSVVKIH